MSRIRHRMAYSLICDTVTPEKLCTSDFLELLGKVHATGSLNRLVVDEAHCISVWGFDFRPGARRYPHCSETSSLINHPEYQRISIFRRRFPDVPIMALTATADALLQDHIVQNLKLSPEHMLKVVHPFNRPEIFYEV